MKRADKREHLIKVATKIFNQYGYHAAGVDKVIDEAGVAKTTLYRHFETKEDLIVAVLQKVDEEYRERMRLSVEEKTENPEQRILATFDFIHTWFVNKSFYGCPFTSAAAEYSDKKSPVFQEAKLHKKLMIAYFEELARSAKIDDPGLFAEQINILHEGAIAVAHVALDYKAGMKAKGVAQKLLDQVRL